MFVSCDFPDCAKNYYLLGTLLNIKFLIDKRNHKFYRNALRISAVFSINIACANAEFMNAECKGISNHMVLYGVKQ